MATKIGRDMPRTATNDMAYENDPVEGFDVTCTIGRVTFGESGGMTPTEAAFLLIARHGAEGHFTFPHETGGTFHVTVDVDHG
jgi:hypothetical protein